MSELEAVFLELRRAMGLSDSNRASRDSEKKMNCFSDIGQCQFTLQFFPCRGRYKQSRPHHTLEKHHLVAANFKYIMMHY